MVTVFIAHGVHQFSNRISIQFQDIHTFAWPANHLQNWPLQGLQSNSQFRRAFEITVLASIVRILRHTEILNHKNDGEDFSPLEDQFLEKKVRRKDA